MKFEAVNHRLKRFEEQDVKGSRVGLPRKIVDIPMDLTVDEKIEVTFKAIVVGASFDVDRRTGELIRSHKIRILDAEVEPL